MRFLLWSFSVVCLLLGGRVHAQQNHEKTIRVTAVVQESPAQITLNWLAPGSGTYVITHQKLYRRSPGQFWGDEHAPLEVGDLSYVDTNVEPGVVYEYRLVRVFSNGPRSSTGYLETGIQLREVDCRGSVILLVKETELAALSAGLIQLQEDLAGDGWRIIREEVTDAHTVTEVKEIIAGHYQNPATPDVRSVFIFGRVPVPYSGLIAPDGHANHVGAWPADVFYGEMDGAWTDTEVDDTGASGTRNDNVPGDGKYDQSALPSSVELEVGRVDLANMTLFPDSATTEEDLLLRYLNRNHDYRHLKGEYTSIPRRGLIDGSLLAFRGEDTFASNPWWNFTAFFGAENVDSLDWLTTLDTEKYLWAYGAGGGTFTSASGVGNSTQFGTTDSKAVFCMMLGSYFGDWDTTNNFLRAPLAGTEGGLALANMWAGRPHWHIHSMAMGETLGLGTRRTQNNRGDYSSGFGASGVHIALLGDPTLRLFPVKAPSALGQTASPGAVNLTWTASPDSNLQGYVVYRGTVDARSTGAFSRVNGDLVVGQSFSDLSGVPGTAYTYMVRAVKLETSASGTYRNSSQGIFIDAMPGGVSGPEMNVSGDGEPIQAGSTGALAGNLTDFGNGEINLDLIGQTFVIKNEGSTDLNLLGGSPVSLSGVHATEFLVTEQPAVSVLTPGSVVEFTIQFSPTSLGIKNAVVSIASDDPDEGIFTFSVMGQGVPNVPEIEIETTDYRLVLGSEESDSETIVIRNGGIGDLNYEVTSQYAFRDSGHPSGPIYDWVDISTVGTEITSWSGSTAPTDNGGSESISIGFDFPFYGESQTALRVSTEGFLIFGDWVDAPTNASFLPNLGAPQNMIGIYWDDLDLRSDYDEADQGRVYFHQIDPDTFIVQYDGVYRYSSDPMLEDERLTCQAILKSSGEIILQYQSVPTAMSYLLGIQNANLDQGLTVAANSPVITESVAVRIVPPAADSWLGLSPSAGTTMTGIDSEVVMTFDSSGLPFGDYFGLLYVTSNDPDTPLLAVEVELKVGEGIPAIALTGNGKPVPSQTALPETENDTDFGFLAVGDPAETKTYTITNTGNGDLILGGLSLTGSSFILTQPETTILSAGANTTFSVTLPSGLPAGAFSETVMVPTNDANEPVIEFVVQASKITPIEEWRLLHFGSTNNDVPGDNVGDPDGDGLNNLIEYALGGNPNLEDAALILPTCDLDEGGRVRMTFQRDSSKNDLNYIVQASSTLGDSSWVDIAMSEAGGVTAATPSGAVTVVEAGTPLVEVSVTDSEASPVTRFLRLKLVLF